MSQSVALSHRDKNHAENKHITKIHLIIHDNSMSTVTCQQYVTEGRNRPIQVTNHKSLFRSRDWLSANKGSVFPDSYNVPHQEEMVSSEMYWRRAFFQVSVFGSICYSKAMPFLLHSRK